MVAPSETRDDISLEGIVNKLSPSEKRAEIALAKVNSKEISIDGNAFALTYLYLRNIIYEESAKETNKEYTIIDKEKIIGFVSHILDLDERDAKYRVNRALTYLAKSNILLTETNPKVRNKYIYSFPENLENALTDLNSAFDNFKYGPPKQNSNSYLTYGREGNEKVDPIKRISSLSNIILKILYDKLPMNYDELEYQLKKQRQKTESLQEELTGLIKSKEILLSEQGIYSINYELLTKERITSFF
jgi:hypothetical protein